MRAWKKILFAPLALLLITLPFQHASADIAPKPAMNFVFEQEFAGEQLSITAGGLLECDQPDCSDARLLEKIGSQGLYCAAITCNAVSYGFSPYHRLEIQFSDGKTRRSNVFKTDGLTSSYQVTIRQDDLLVKTELMPDYLSPAVILLFCGCCLSLLFILAGFVILLLLRKARKK